MIVYSEHEFYRGYAICLTVEGEKRGFVAVQGTESWWEAASADDVKSLIDTAMDA